MNDSVSQSYQARFVRNNKLQNSFNLEHIRKSSEIFAFVKMHGFECLYYLYT